MPTRKITRIALAFLALVLSVGISRQSAAQDEPVRTASPNSTKIEISGREPVPSDLPVTLLFSGGGGGGEPSGDTLAWVQVPDDIDQGGDFVACGYKDASEAPVGALTYPSGKTTAVNVIYGRAGTPDSGCASYSLPFQYGMELGGYTLQFKDSQGDLSYTWNVDYSYCYQSMIMLEESEREQDFMMGLVPGEHLSVVFYADFGLKGGYVNYDFVAKRNFVADADGAAFLDIQLKPSAGFTFGTTDPSAGPSLRYYVFNAKGESLQVFGDPVNGEVTKFPPLASPPATYPTYYLANDIYTTGPCFHGVINPPQSNADTAAHEVYVQVNTLNGQALPLYADFQAMQPTGQLANGSPVSVLQRKTGQAEGRAHYWYQIQTEDGKQAWAYGPNFAYIFPIAASGSHGKVVMANTILRQSADSITAAIKALAKDTPIIVIQAEGQGATVKLDDGTVGYLPNSAFTTYPWSPADVSAELAKLPALPTVTPTPAQPTEISQTTATSPFACAAPSTRLTVGKQGRVLPDKANRVRHDPGGDSIGKIPVGDVFDVIDGPDCTSDGTVWWEGRLQRSYWLDSRGTR